MKERGRGREGEVEGEGEREREGTIWHEERTMHHAVAWVQH
jgi:hypothetical protein